MNYEIALKLKEAGFPQGAENHHGNGTWYEGGGKEIDHKSDESNVYKPVLHELMNACGDGLEGLARGVEKELGAGWRAVKNPSFKTSALNAFTGCFGLTKEEAVARLWIQLNHEK